MHNVFSDWMLKRGSDDNWITVLESTEHKNKYPIDTSNSIISVISKNNNFEKLFKCSDWYINEKFGCPEIWTEKKKIKYNPNYECVDNGITYSPFVIHRYWYTKYAKEKYELIQDFNLFYNLYYDETLNHFVAFKDSGEPITVIKFSENDNDYKIEIATNFLKNYLAFKNSTLLRFHTRKLSDTNPIEDTSIIDKDEIIKEDKCIFNISAYNDIAVGEYKSYFLLCGKDIIQPFDNKKNLLSDEKKYQSFITNVNDEGVTIEHSCEDIFHGQIINGVKYTTPIFFNRYVLKHYYDNPKKYTITSELLSCGKYWYITIDENPSGLIQVYLGDLGTIPYSEQTHWKYHNVKPEGGISQSRHEQDVEAQFVDSKEPMSCFYKSFTELQDCFYQKYEFKLFRTLTGDDQHINNTLRIPLNNEINEFEQQILYLAKFLNETINKVKICEHIPKLDKSKESIKTLKLFLDHEKINSDICNILFKIQNIRSSSVVHAKGKKYGKNMTKYELDNGRYQDFFKHMIIDLTRNMRKICANIIDDVNDG